MRPPPRTVVLVVIAWSAVGLPIAGAQPPSLDTVLARAAAYVADFNRKLQGIVAEESYVQEVKNQSNATMLGSNRGGGLPRRTLKSDFLLVKPDISDRHVEFRDVFEVDGQAVRDREDRLTQLFVAPSGDYEQQMRRLIDESARYNIGNIPRNVNTPMLSLLFLQESYQPRFRFKRAGQQAPNLASLIVLTQGGPSPVFRATTEMWVVEFRERSRNTVIRTNEGRDFPATGRFWIDPATGAVLLSELMMDSPDVRAVINVSYQSEPLLGFNVPVEMREQYRTRFDRVDGVATYGRFRQFQVKTDEHIGLPAEGGAKKPPPR